MGHALIERGIDHLLRVMDRTGCRVIMDHHARPRQRDIRERFGRLWETGRVVTAAGYLGLADAPLETRAGQLGARCASRRRVPRRPAG